MRFGYTIIYVPDVERAVAFYEQAFGLERRFVHESGSYGELETGGTALAFASHEQAGSNLPGGFTAIEPSAPPVGIEVGLVTDDVGAAYERAVAAGATPLTPPYLKPWGQTVSYVRDLNGVLVEICSPVG